MDHEQSVPKSLGYQKKFLPDGLSDLRQLPPNPQNNACYVFRNGIYYVFTENGSLSYLEWFADGIHFYLPNPDFPEHGNNEIINGLLSASEEEALVSLTKLCNAMDITPQLTQVKKPGNVISIISAAILAAGIVLLLFYIRLRKIKSV